MSSARLKFSAAADSASPSRRLNSLTSAGTPTAWARAATAAVSSRQIANTRSVFPTAPKRVRSSAHSARPLTRSFRPSNSRHVARIRASDNRRFIAPLYARVPPKGNMFPFSRISIDRAWNNPASCPFFESTC